MLHEYISVPEAPQMLAHGVGCTGPDRLRVRHASPPCRRPAIAPPRNMDLWRPGATRRGRRRAAAAAAAEQATSADQIFELCHTIGETLCDVSLAFRCDL